MPKRSALRLTKRIVDRLTADGKDAIFWDRDTGRLRSASPHQRAQALHRPVQGAGRPQAGHARAGGLGNHRGAPARGGRSHRPHQAGRGPEAACPRPRSPISRRAGSGTMSRPGAGRTRYTGYRLALRNPHPSPPSGKTKLQDVAPEDVAALHHALRDMPYAANNAIWVLSRHVQAG